MSETESDDCTSEEIKAMDLKHHLLQFTILLGSILLSRSAHINSSLINETATESKAPDDEQYANETAIQILALQKEKDDLYNKINKAIDEAIPELEKTNETEAITGLQHLKTLKQQIKEIHEAESDEELIGNFSETNNNTDFRRKLSISIDRKGQNKGNWMAMMKKDEFYQKLIKARDKKYTSMPNVLNRQKIANQIQDWLAKKAAEKKKIKEYKARMKIDYERCPDYGKGKERKKSGKKKSNGKKKIYPCCRKCCKKSYLGCL